MTVHEDVYFVLSHEALSRVRSRVKRLFIFSTLKARFVSCRYSSRTLEAKLFTIALGVLQAEDEIRHRAGHFRYEVVQREEGPDVRRCEGKVEGWESEIAGSTSYGLSSWPPAANVHGQ